MMKLNPTHDDVVFMGFLQFLTIAPLSLLFAFHTPNDYHTFPRPNLITKHAISISNGNSFISNFGRNDSHIEIDTSIQKKTRKKTTKSLPSYIHLIDKEDDFKKTVEEEKEKIVVVRFFAYWCKTCKSMSPYYYRMAEKLHENIIFVEIPHSPETAALYERLDVPGVPFGHIYHPKHGLMHKTQLSKRSDSSDFEKNLKRILFCT